MATSYFRIAVDSGGLTTATTSYTAGDQVATQFTLANAAQTTGGYGRIIAVTLTDAADLIGAYDVVFTRASITPASDNAAYAISDADAKSIIGVATLSGAYDIGNNRVGVYYGPPIMYDTGAGTSLFATLITRSSHSFFGAVTDLQLQVYCERY